jgi:hypothetical protein
VTPPRRSLRRKREPGPFARWRTRTADRLARSSHVFLLFVVVACGIEVLVDWNATLFQINVLRDDVRQKGQSYVGILTRASTDAMRARDADALGRLSGGLFDDPDVVYVRFADPAGRITYDRLRPGHDDAVRAGEGLGEGEGPGFRERYDAQMAKDIHDLIADPERLRRHISRSHYRDFDQSWSDAVNAGLALIVTPRPPAPTAASPVVYQDRLASRRGKHDANATYALGPVVDERGAACGVVLVCFSMERTNAAIRTKYLKGAGMVAFFVALILVQNVLSRRDKLKLLDLESRHASAKRALREALPEENTHGPLRLGAAIDQAEGPVDGMVWDRHVEAGHLELLMIDPDGDGIDAASTALHVLRAYRDRRAAGVTASFGEELSALGKAALIIPLTRPIALLLLRIDASSGAFEVITSPLGHAWIVHAGAATPAAAAPSSEAPAGVVGPLRSLTGTLPAGALLCLIGAGPEGPATGQKIDHAAIAGFVARTHHEGDDLAGLAEDAVTWSRGRSSELATEDLVVAVLARGAPAADGEQAAAGPPGFEPGDGEGVA